VQWNKREYDIDAGIIVLMSVIQNPGETDQQRELAVDRLRMLSTQLKGRKTVDELLQLYPTLGTRGCKVGVLVCLGKSDDPRALPLFVKVLDEEQDLTRRLVAAYGLANWNVGRGVGELIRLLECTTSIEDCAAVRDQAANNLHGLNDRKAWGCPEDKIRDLAAAASNGDSDEYVKTFSRGYREWFEANRMRFPDWTVGDPLPEVEPGPGASVAAQKAWKCDRSCAKPADTDDCATCCVTKDSCVYCCSGTAAEQREECGSHCAAAFGP